MCVVLKCLKCLIRIYFRRQWSTSYIYVLRTPPGRFVRRHCFDSPDVFRDLGDDPNRDVPALERCRDPVAKLV